jgi:hypothetical protein
MFLLYCSVILATFCKDVSMLSPVW